MDQVQQILLNDFQVQTLNTLDKLKLIEGIDDKDVQGFTDNIKKDFAKLKSSGRGTFWSHSIMIWIIFLIGIVFIGLSIWNFLQDPTEPFSYIGTGALGVIDFFGLMLYKPLYALQKANSDHTQHIMIVVSFSTMSKMRQLQMEKPDGIVKKIDEIVANLKKDLEFTLNLLTVHLETKK